MKKPESKLWHLLRDGTRGKVHWTRVESWSVPGVPDLNGYGKGDLLVHVNVWTPKTLNKEQKQFFQKMLEDENFTPNPDKSDKSFFEKVKDMFA